MTGRALLAGYLRAGWAVTPLVPGTKRPYLNGWGERPIRTLEEWDRAAVYGAGVGILTGAVSELAALDVDGPAGWTAACKRLGCGDEDRLYQALLDTEPVGVSCAGDPFARRRLQAFWRLPNALRDLRRVDLAAELQLRGAGCQSAVRPTVHPTAAPYRWIATPDLRHAAELPECFREQTVPVVHREPRPSINPWRPRSADPLLDLDAEVYVEVLTGTVAVQGRAVCPLHAPVDGENPSLVCDGRLWACHSAGCTPNPRADVAGGSVIDFASRLWNIEPRGKGYWQLRDRLVEVLEGIA